MWGWLLGDGEEDGRLLGIRSVQDCWPRLESEDSKPTCSRGPGLDDTQRSLPAPPARDLGILGGFSPFLSSPFAEGTARANGCWLGQGHLPSPWPFWDQRAPRPAHSPAWPRRRQSTGRAVMGLQGMSAAGPSAGGTQAAGRDPWGGLSRVLLAGLGWCVIPGRGRTRF